MGLYVKQHSVITSDERHLKNQRFLHAEDIW